MSIYPATINGEVCEVTPDFSGTGAFMVKTSVGTFWAKDGNIDVMTSAGWRPETHEVVRAYVAAVIVIATEQVFTPLPVNAPVTPLVALV